MRREAYIYKAFIDILSVEFVTEGVIGVEIGPIDNVVRTGPPSGKAVLFQRIVNNPRGNVGRNNRYDRATDDFTHTETQAVEATYQFTCLCPLAPEEDFPLMPSDLADMTRSFLLSDRAIDEFRLIGAQPQSASIVRDLFHKDESGRLEKQPSFDLVLTGSIDVIRKVSIADPVTGEFYRAQQG